MRLNLISTTWITILILAAVLMSGFTSSSTMMNNAMPHSGHATALNCPSFQNSPSSTHHNMAMSHSIDVNGQCEVVTDVMHDCCDATCATSVAIFITPSMLMTISASRALLALPPSGDVIHQTKSLYRPPIA